MGKNKKKTGEESEIKQEIANMEGKKLKIKLGKHLLYI